MLTQDQQNQFSYQIGQLDRLLSVLIQYGKEKSVLDEANQQTLKYHAEDMIGAGNKILSLLNPEEDDEIDTIPPRAPKKRSVVTDPTTAEVLATHGIDVDDEPDEDTPTTAELFMDQVAPTITEIRVILSSILKGINKLTEMK